VEQVVLRGHSALAEVPAPFDEDAVELFVVELQRGCSC
jgi:hypothetical protein